MKNIQQFYDTPRVISISGKHSTFVKCDPPKIRDIEFDLSIIDSTATPAYRALANDMLMQLLQFGNFPFADKLLQNIQSQKQQIESGQMPEGLSPELLQKIQQNADMNAVGQAQRMLGQAA